MKEKSMCGLYCSTCEFVEKCGCKGCVESQGKPFHGECPIAICCMDKSLEHCGTCEEFPCKQLNAYSYDETHGDNAKRIEESRKWIAESDKFFKSYISK